MAAVHGGNIQRYGFTQDTGLHKTDHGVIPGIKLILLGDLDAASGIFIQVPEHFQLFDRQTGRSLGEDRESEGCPLCGCLCDGVFADSGYDKIRTRVHDFPVAGDSPDAVLSAEPVRFFPAAAEQSGEFEYFRQRLRDAYVKE